tara:strand:- start:285 stop:800 length:516 start_codon:yes stop_codon:yes gene_type:complete
MKKLFIYFLLLALFGCNNINKNNQTSDNLNCPRIFFSSEDKVFIETIGNSNSFEDISLKAELNNFAIFQKCYQKDDIFIIPLDILIIAKPMNKLQNTDLSMPLYVILLDQNNKVLESQYFMVSNSIKKNFENNVLIETDITDRLEIITENLETAQIVIGFMIDDNKRLLLN